VYPSSIIDRNHQYPTWEFISFTDETNIPSKALLEKLVYKDLGYIASKESEVFGKWITEATEAEIFMTASQKF